MIRPYSVIRNHQIENDVSDESYSSAQSGDRSLASHKPLLSTSFSLRTPKPVKRISGQSTPRKYNSQLQDSMNYRNEARPSPERIDAQIRQLSHSIELLKQQNSDYYKMILSKLDEIAKISAKSNVNDQYNLQKPTEYYLQKDIYGHYNENHNEFLRSSSASNTTNVNHLSLSQNLYGQRQLPYSHFMYPQVDTMAALQSYYNGGPLTFSDSPAMPAVVSRAQHLSTGFCSSYSVSPLYRPLLEQSNTSIESMSHTSLQNASLDQRISVGLQNYHSKPVTLQPQIVNSNITDAPITEAKHHYATSKKKIELQPVSNKIPTSLNTFDALPLNVVITSSDTVPTTVPETQPMLCVSIPIQHRLGTSFSNNSVNQFQRVPHTYQMSMPTQETLPTTVYLPPLTSALANMPSSIKSIETQDSGGFLTDSSYSRQNLSSEVVEVEHDPIPDFIPIIPLPDEIDVTTGEENEEVLFCSNRAKLYRFCDKEWKERGIGVLKILKNTNGKVRLLMRREQVFKICANHLLRKDMELVSMPNTDKAFMWIANDFSDEELKLEKLCIKFKTTPEAQQFKNEFNFAKSILPSNVVGSNQNDNLDRFDNDEEKYMNNATADQILDQQLKPNRNLLDQEIILVESKITFSHFCNDAKFFKKKGNGTLKVFLKTSSGKLRFLIITDNKTALLDQSITSNSVFDFVDDSLKWKVNIGGHKFDSYLIQFHNSNEAATFLKETSKYIAIFDNNLNDLLNNEVKPISELLKPDIDSWECQDCYTWNKKSSNICASCQAPIRSTHKSVFKASNDLYEQSKPSTDSWECKNCYVNNMVSIQYCVACDEPKNINLPPKPKASGFILNSNPTENPSNFSFGIPHGNQIRGLDLEKFTFHSSSVESHSTLNTGSSEFLSSSNNMINSKSTKNVHGKSFTFGSPGKSFDFQFHIKSSLIKSPLKQETSDDDTVEESEDVYFPPVIPLPEKIDVITGEENEVVHFSHRAKLFKFDTDTKEWKERGLGDIKLLRHVETNKLRLVMRREQVLKLCLNHIVDSSIDMTSKDSKTWMWSAGDFSDGELQYMQFACRFKTPDIAQEFKKAIYNACSQIFFTKSTITSRNDQAKEYSLQNESTSEIQVIYEFKVTAQQRAAAIKLYLPENFYSYEKKPECPGCIGCLESEEELTENYLDESQHFDHDEKKIVEVYSNNFFSNLQSSDAATEKSEHTETATFNFGDSNSVEEITSTSSTSQQHIFSLNGKDENSKEMIQDSVLKNDHLSFLPTENSLTFSALAVKTSVEPKCFFKTDPNFKFDRAGESVFGSKIKQKISPLKVLAYDITEKRKKEPFEDVNVNRENDGCESAEEYDPYFEPIIPLPSTIEVKTGEEDEEKKFCQRAKLYRYDQTLKEWKERGTGEMKLLYHSNNGTYRLLLRREQVHKVVCNLLLTSDMEFHSLNSSDRAWMWAGMNYAEPEKADIEQLAVKFKTPQLATQFKEEIKVAQNYLLSKPKLKK